MTTSSGPDDDTCNCILNLLQTVLLCRCKFPEGTDAEIQPWHSESLEFNVPSAAHEYLTTIIGGSCHKSHFCRDKSLCLSRQNTSFVATKVCLSRQKLCVCRDKCFVATNIFLSRPKLYLRQLPPKMHDDRLEMDIIMLSLDFNILFLSTSGRQL